MRDKLFGKGGLFFSGDDRDLLSPAVSRYERMPASSNIQGGTPLSWVEQDVLEDRPEFSAPKQYGDLRTNYMYAHPPDPNSWAGTHMASDTNIPLTPMADPDAVADPSILARQRMPPGPPLPLPMYRGNYAPGMTLNSMPGFQ